MLEDVINKFLERYQTDFSLGGYSLHKITHAPSLSVLNMISDDYFFTFTFLNEMPYRLLINIKRSDQLQINENNKNDILNRELSFFPFNNHKHEILDSIQKMVGERLGLYEAVEAIDEFSQSSSSNLYNIRGHNKLFQACRGMDRTIGGQKALRFNNYVINVTKDGEIFYGTKTYFSYDDDCFIFDNNNQFYSYGGVDYIEDDLESLFFKIIVNQINNEIFKATDISLFGQSEDCIKKTIDVYKMLKI